MLATYFSGAKNPTLQGYVEALKHIFANTSLITSEVIAFYFFNRFDLLQCIE